MCGASVQLQHAAYAVIRPTISKTSSIIVHVHRTNAPHKQTYRMHRADALHKYHIECAQHGDVLHYQNSSEASPAHIAHPHSTWHMAVIAHGRAQGFDKRLVAEKYSTVPFEKDNEKGSCGYVEEVPLSLHCAVSQRSNSRCYAYACAYS